MAFQLSEWNVSANLYERCPINDEPRWNLESFGMQKLIEKWYEFSDLILQLHLSSVNYDEK